MSDRTALAEHVAARLRASLPGDAKVCVALSGGRDSVTLLHLLHGLAGPLHFSLSALHVNHGLSPNARLWENFCRALCARLGVPFNARRVPVARDSGSGIAAAARAARYIAFA